jgi:tetratricopeptide (TPR) repeat protein
MRWCLDRWRGRAALFVVALAAAAPSAAGPVNSSQDPQARMEEIEKAGDKLKARQPGAVDEAYKLLQEAVKKKTDLPPARLMLARLMMHQQLQDYHQMVRGQLELAASEEPGHPEIYLTNAGLALSEGRVTDALLNGDKALALTAADRWTAAQKKSMQTDARKVLAAGYEARRDWPAARAQLAALLDADPKNGQLRSRLARAVFFLPGDKEDEAYRELIQAVKDDTVLEPPTVSMARLWNAKGDMKKAREWFEKAVKGEPNSARVHVAYADWLMQQNEIEQAKLHIDQAAKINANDPEVQKFQGLIARIQGDLGTAERIFKQILNSAPDDTFARNQLALVLADQSGDAPHKLAVQYAELNAKANQKSPEALATLGYVYYRAGNVDEAIKMLQLAVNAGNGQLSPDTAYYLAACIYEKDKEKAEDVKKFLKAALDAKGLFVYKKDAQKLLDRVAKAPPPKASSSAK